MNSLFNIRGQLVKTLLDSSLQSGHHTVIWNGRDRYESPVASGVYLYRITSGGKTATGKMMLLK